MVSQLSIQIGEYTLTDNFYVLSLGNIDAVLGLQWLQSLGRYIQDSRRMELELMVDDKKIVLKAMPDGGPQVVSAKRMEA